MGLFITFEGTEGSGKSTQIKRLADRVSALGHEVVVLREPGGTPIGEEIRHLLKHSAANHAMTPEAELLLMNAARAQLVREVIRPALVADKVVLCDRFFDSSLVYQGHGRGLDLVDVRRIINYAVGDTLPDLTLLLRVPLAVSEQRRAARQAQAPERDRFEETDRGFFERVEAGYDNLGAAEGDRVRTIDATKSIDDVASAIWLFVNPLFEQRTVQGEVACKSVGEEGRGRE
ncbi:MAG TPA: dTMP kinase [Verrucomicrobiae bacterium]|nr:dTMP kinase [Verrucomicrobiae bacterium]